MTAPENASKTTAIMGAGAAINDDAAAEAARLYYLEDESKVAIAEALGVTRFQVARLLQHARRTEIVKITVRTPSGLNPRLGQGVASSLGLREVHVFDDAVVRPDLDGIGKVMARTLIDLAKPGDIVGLTWSQAIVAMSKFFDGLPECTAVQLAGQAPSSDSLPDSAEIVRRAAASSGGTALALAAPMLVTDASAVSSILRQPQIAAAVEMFTRLDVAVISIGSWRPGESTVFDASTASDHERANARAAIGEISGRLFNGAGEPVDDVLGERIVGIYLDQLRRTPTIIGASFGAIRAEATIAAARGGLVHHLVIDTPLAEAIVGLC